MMDFSNIFYKEPDNKGQKKEDPAVPSQPEKKKDGPVNKLDMASLFSIHEAKIDEEIATHQRVAQKIGREDSALEMRLVYKDAAALAATIFESSTDLTEDQLDSVLAFVQTLVEIVQEKKYDLIEYVFVGITDTDKVNPYVLKFINVCILSIEMGIALEYNDMQLVQLGVAAFLHDIQNVTPVYLKNAPKKSVISTTLRCK